MERRVSRSGSIVLLNNVETSPVLLINPVFTITANNWAAACEEAARRRCFPKVRQKSKSSGASPQKYPSNGKMEQYGEEFINIITSSESLEIGDEDFVSSRSSGRSFHSNPYLNMYSGSNSKLLQVPSSSAMLLPVGDWSPERGRQQRSSSITVPMHLTPSPERAPLVATNMRRCSSASPKGRYLQYQQQAINKKAKSPKRRRSSAFSRDSRRQSIQSALTHFSSSSSSIDSAARSPRKQRLLSMPIGPSPDIDKKKSKETDRKLTGSCHDVVIIGSPAVGKSTLAEYFERGGGSGSDQGIGSEEDDSDHDQDLNCGGKAIVYRPKDASCNFSLRIFCQQTSAVNHLYKYDAVILVYSVTDRDSFRFARNALSKLPPKKTVILVANKSDLERSRTVTTIEGRSLATAYDVKFIEISSSLGVGVENLQKGLATQIQLRSNGKTSASSSSNCSSSASSSMLVPNSGSFSKKGVKKSSLKVAQKLIERLLSLRLMPSQSTKSCLDLHTL